MNELQAAAKWLYTTLAAHAGVSALVGTRVYEGRRPPGTALPAIVFQHLGGADRRAMGADKRLFSRPVFLVKAIAEGESYASADAIASAIDAALQGVGGTATVGDQDYTIRGCERLEPVRYLEAASDQTRFNHSGGQFRLFVFPTP